MSSLSWACPSLPSANKQVIQATLSREQFEAKELMKDLLTAEGISVELSAEDNTHQAVEKTVNDKPTAMREIESWFEVTRWCNKSARR